MTGTQIAREQGSQMTTDHQKIRQWAEQRGGRPATVGGTESTGEHAGILRLEFPHAANSNDENLEPISWDEFFRKFDEADLAFLYQDETKSGAVSRFFKFVRRY